MARVVITSQSIELGLEFKFLDDINAPSKYVIGPPVFFHALNVQS